MKLSKLLAHHSIKRKMVNMHNTADTLWRKIIFELGRNVKEIKTIDSAGCNNNGKWFSVRVVDEIVYISEAKMNKPSSTLAMDRPISQKEFVGLYPNYYKWRTGIMSREQAKGNSMNSSYIFALIHFFEKN